MVDNLRDEILNLEEQFWLEGGGNPEFWAEHFADGGLVALPFGIMDKPRTLEAMAQAEPWIKVDMEDVRMVPAGDDAALLTYQGIAARADGDDYSAVIGSLYVRHSGRWLLAFHQQSPASGRQGA